MNPVAIIFDNFGPYHLARLRAAAGKCDLLAIEVAGRSATYAWDATPDSTFRRETLLDGSSANVARGEIGRRLAAALERFRPAVVVVPGWATPAAWAALEWCARRGVAAVCLSESTAWDEPASGWKLAVKLRLVRQFAAALVGGRHHVDYLTQLGMTQERIFFGYDAVDNDYFAAGADAIRGNSPHARRQHDLPKNYFLASARFVEKKNLARLLEAFAAYRARAGVGAWSLVLLGDGELRPALEQKRDTLGLREHVLMPGFRQYGELPAYYALAGAFILASTVEPWGLVVNEAAASGLPLLVSNRCGCAPELVQEGVNGFTFDPLDVSSLAHLMGKIAAPDFPRAGFASASRQIVAPWGPERFASGLTQAVDAALAHTPPTPGVIDRALLAILARR
jgi:glycosyltransferase involved in cell wall biosynthesis